MSSIESVMKVIRSAQNGSGEEDARSEVVAAAIDEVVRITAETYTRESDSYAQARTSQPWSHDAEMNGSLLSLVRERVASGEIQLGDLQRWRLLDVGAGYGRDVLRFRTEPDIEAVALEKAPGFILALRRLQADGSLPQGAVIPGDMRDMSAIRSGSFHCVRNHATLHHLPVVPHGLGADEAVAESRRVLADGGVFYVLVKGGAGIDMIDTREGLGGRFFQLFTTEMLVSLLERHSFSVQHLEECVEPRSSGDVKWLFALATAV